MDKGIREYFIKQLQKEHAFWNWNQDEIKHINDDTIIEYSILYLDMEEIILLFDHFEKKRIKEIWLKKLVRQEPMYHNLNRLMALLFFGIKNPDRYLAVSKKKILKKLYLC